MKKNPGSAGHVSTEVSRGPYEDVYETCRNGKVFNGRPPESNAEVS